MQPVEPPMLGMLDAYRAAVLAKDVDAFIGLYAADVLVFDLWSEWSYDGVEAWRRMVVQAFVSYKGVSESGREEHAMQNRLSWVLRSQKKNWKIIHEHTSAPADFATSKIILSSPAK